MSQIYLSSSGLHALQLWHQTVFMDALMKIAQDVKEKKKKNKLSLLQAELECVLARSLDCSTVIGVVNVLSISLSVLCGRNLQLPGAIDLPLTSSYV